MSVEAPRVRNVMLSWDFTKRREEAEDEASVQIQKKVGKFSKEVKYEINT